MFEGFIFDVEGTLLDSVSQNQRSLQDALEKSGYRVPIQTLRLYSGLDGDQTLQLVVPDASGRERIAILEDRRKIYERDYLPSVRPLEGARDVWSGAGASRSPRIAKGFLSRATCRFWTLAIISR
jgi:beta-phosphoglucomutase-like phosphatase (HAD superfamily)